MAKKPEVPTPGVKDIVDLVEEATNPDAHQEGEKALERALQGEVATTVEAAQTLELFSNTNRSEILARLGFEAPSEKDSRPSERVASYLIVDNDSIDEISSDLRAEISVIADVRDFDITQDSQGNLVILALSERSGVKKLLDIATSLSQRAPQTRMTLGTGPITHHDEKEFSIGQYPSTDWKTPLSEGHTISISSVLADLIDDPNSRVGSNVSIETETLDSEGFLLLKSVKSKVALETGGPDRLIGYTQEFEELWALLTAEDTDRPTRLINLEGAAGMGKSRLLKEILDKHPSFILCSIDSTDKNVVGSSLVTVADQLIEALNEDPLLDLADVADASTSERIPIDGELAERADAEIDKLQVTLSEFSKWSNAEKTQFAAKHPDCVADLCYNALMIVNFQKARNTLFVLEDIHHADRVSEPFLVHLVRRYLVDTEGKAVLSNRPEEMFKSTSLQNLAENVVKDNLSSEEAAQTVKLEGLDFSDAWLAHSFAFYSLPEVVRINYATGSTRNLGPWYRKLGEIAGNSPWAMKSLMDTILEVDPETSDFKWLKITDENIDIDRTLLDRLESIDPASSADIANYFHERISALDETSRRILQSIALMGGKATKVQVIDLIDLFEAGRDSSEAFRTTSEQLIKGGYIHETPDGNFELQHESTRDIVIGSITDKAEKVQLAKYLLAEFRAEPQAIHPDAMHSLYSTIADSDDPVTTEATFWDEYTGATNERLQDAREHNATGAAFRVASTVLETSQLKDTISRLTAGKEVSEARKRLAIETLFARAENARFLGKFAEVDSCVADLEAIHERHSEDVDMARAHVIRFEKAYMLSDTAQMRKIYEEDLEGGDCVDSEAINILLQAKLAFKELRFDDAIELFSSENRETLARLNREHQRNHHTPHPEFIDLLRIIRSRCPFEKTRQAIIRRDGEITFDEDAAMQPLAVTAEQEKEITKAKAALDKIGEVTRKFPLIFNPFSEVNILDQQGEMACYLGDYDAAIKFFSETWRQADQMEVHSAAARAALLKAKAQVMQVLTSPEIEATTKREGFKRAIRTLSTEGNISLDKVSEKADYQLLLRAERIRAIGIFAESYRHQTPHTRTEEYPTTRAELEPQIRRALQDYKHINDNWAEQAKNPETVYYIMSYMGHILHAAAEFDIPTPEIDLDQPFLDLQQIGHAIHHGTTVTDLGFGEVDMKMEGLVMLMNALRRQRDAKLVAEKALENAGAV